MIIKRAVQKVPICVERHKNDSTKTNYSGTRIKVQLLSERQNSLLS